jgi:hypothetical protein
MLLHVNASQAKLREHKMKETQKEANKVAAEKEKQKKEGRKAFDALNITLAKFESSFEGLRAKAPGSGLLDDAIKMLELGNTYKKIACATMSEAGEMTVDLQTMVRFAKRLGDQNKVLALQVKASRGEKTSPKKKSR